MWKDAQSFQNMTITIMIIRLQQEAQLIKKINFVYVSIEDIY